MENVGIYIGTPSETVKAAAKSVMEILNCSGTDEKTKQMAIKCLGAIAGSPQHTTISHVNLNMAYKETEDDQEYEEPED